MTEVIATVNNTCREIWNQLSSSELKSLLAYVEMIPKSDLSRFRPSHFYMFVFGSVEDSVVRNWLAKSLKRSIVNLISRHEMIDGRAYCHIYVELSQYALLTPLSKTKLAEHNFVIGKMRNSNLATSIISIIQEVPRPESLPPVHIDTTKDVDKSNNSELYMILSMYKELRDAKDAVDRELADLKRNAHLCTNCQKPIHSRCQQVDTEFIVKFKACTELGK